MSNKPNLLRTRFAAIESLLIWERQVGNSRLRSLFDLQSVQASRLIAAYRRAYPKALVEDTKHKRFLPSPHFAPKVASGTLDEYAAWIAMTSEGDGARYFEDARFDLTDISPEVFAAVRTACVHRVGMRIHYESMSHPKGKWRSIYPHTLVRVGRRWHARAYCTENGDYRDFNLGRIQAARQEHDHPVERRLPIDVAWNSIVAVSLQPHSGLEPERADVIRRELFNARPNRRLKVRACLLPYVLHDLRVAVDPLKQAPPDYQLELANASRLKKHLFND